MDCSLNVQTSGKHNKNKSSSIQPWQKAEYFKTIFMKPVLAISIGVLTLSAMSFKKFQQDKVRVLKNGNYHVPAGIITASDAKILGDLTRKTTGESVVVQKTISHFRDNASRKKDSTTFNETTIIHTTVFKHKETVPKETQARVMDVIDKYLR